MRDLFGNVPHPCFYFLTELSDPGVGPVSSFFFFFLSQCNQSYCVSNWFLKMKNLSFLSRGLKVGEWNSSRPRAQDLVASNGIKVHCKQTENPYFYHVNH